MARVHRKAQAALEYLVSYGWMLLIIAIVLAVLYSLGVFNSSLFTPNTCVMPGSFSCQSAVLASNGLLQVSIVQNLQNPINVTAAACDSNQSLIHQRTYTTPVYIAPGQNVSFSVTCWQGTAAFSESSGTLYSGYILLSYTDLATGFNSVAVGTLAVKAS